MCILVQNSPAIQKVILPPDKGVFTIICVSNWPTSFAWDLALAIGERTIAPIILKEVNQIENENGLR
jgi:hypothetical protein